MADGVKLHLAACKSHSHILKLISQNQENHNNKNISLTLGRVKNLSKIRLNIQGQRKDRRVTN